MLAVQSQRRAAVVQTAETLLVAEMCQVHADLNHTAKIVQWFGEQKKEFMLLTFHVSQI